MPSAFDRLAAEIAEGYVGKPRKKGGGYYTRQEAEEIGRETAAVQGRKSLGKKEFVRRSKMARRRRI